ncbi:Na+/H+ antiporter NhaA [Putridiphycobacter roseus]|uniref:Na(+)/H(+) antiporter NhaA n=1 Tax=Putridiphycobacter roseus TaxID=2219161 RepID=A0A2W1N6H9_9FLAO|nr:Na+/H+ antiporter NhaA [Putridiphycobacter roseus]PZE18741.1 Na+/H+ antiporter NhaA [Putridiphycobacter roseus]
MKSNFFQKQSSAGILLFIATIAALIVANSSLSSYYHQFMHLDFTFGFVDSFNITHSLEHWINDGLMAIFFLLVGLEIKSELKFGKLNSIKSALFPTVTAIGGVIVPAIVFYFLNKNSGNIDGWAIPMATDIAFVIGILAIIGSRVPSWVKVFITTVAVVDDLIAVLVIAFFYTDEINVLALSLAVIFTLVLVYFNYKNVYHLAPYLAVGFFLWWAVLASGVHATLAGVILAFTIPLKRDWTIEEIKESATQGFDFYLKAKEKDSPVTMKDAHLNLNKMRLEIESPLKRLERRLHNLVYFIIMPLFAFVNAGIFLDSDILNNALVSTISWGVFLGLLIGKPLGITVSFWIMYKLTIKEKNTPINLWMTIIGVGFLAGIGFTMSLFIANLSYTDEKLLEYAKISILLASIVSGFIGYYILRFKVKQYDEKGFDVS